MESNEIQQQLREAERAAAAPHIALPRSPWWHTLLISLTGPALVLLVTQTQGLFSERTPLGSIPTLTIVLIALVVILDQRKRRGVTPKGKAPQEIRRVFNWYLLGTIILIAGVFALAVTSSLWVSIPVSFVACLGGLTWFGIAYERAADRVRVPLA